MSTERHGRRWNGHEPRSGSSEKENFVVVEKNCSKSPRPPLPDLIPIRKSTAAVVKNPKNRDGNHDAKCWTPNPMECQRQNQMVEEEKISICDKALRDEDKERRRKNGTTKGKECDEKFLENGAKNDDGVGERMASSSSRSCRRDDNELRCGGWEVQPTEPSVNPVFLWVVQDDTEIISVRCEDYDRRNRIRLTKTSNGTWKATPRTQSDDGVEVMRRRKKKKKKERKKHRKEKKRKKKKDDGGMLGVLGQVGSAHELEESSRGSGGGDDVGEKLETTMVLGRGAGAVAADEMDRGDCCTSEGKDGDELSLQQQQQDDVVVQQVQEQEDYAVHGAHGNEQATQHSLGESVYETFEVDTVANCVQNSSCKDTPEEPSLLQQDQHILFASSPTPSPKYHHKGHQTHQQHPPRSPVGTEKTKEEVIEEKFLPFMCKSITEDDAQHSFKQESFADNLNVTTELIDTIREIAVTNTEDLDLTDHCEENTMTGAELLDSLIEHSCEVNNISGHIDDVKQQTPCDVEDDYNEEDELLLDSEPVANIISRLSDSPKCLSFTESGEIETILESGNIFKGTEQSLDDLSLTIKELTETKFMGSEANQKNMSELTSLLSPDSCAEEMPKDLSCKTAGSQQQQQHRSPSPARPTSRGSDTIQSPQPSGLPPIPPSPDTFSQQHRLMQTLPAFPKVSAGRAGGQDGGQHQQQQQQQPEPLNLGVCRKSASPTVSCSEEAKNLLSDLTSGEENLLSSEPVRKRHKSDSYRLDEPKGGHVDKSGKDPDPLTQLRLLMSNSEWKVPNTLLVPKDRLNAVLASPAREIPLLLTTRPELRLPEAFAFPSILQDPDILVVSLNQLETILEKQEELFKVKDTPEVGHQKKQPPPQPQQTTKFPQSHHEIPERQRHAAAQAQMPAAGKFDMDPGTLNLFNQMLWLPYLQNQLRSSQNMGDFMKAPNLRNMPGTFPDLLMLLAAQNNLNTAMPPNFLGCQNPLEFALWQEAMLQESNMNIQQLQRLNAERQGATKKYTPKQNLPKMSPYQQKSTHPMHCMTNPLGNLRFPGTAGGHMGAQKTPTSPFATSPTYPQQRSCGGANIPAHLKNSLSFAHPQSHAHQPAKKTPHQQMNSFPGHFPGATGYTKADYDAVNQQMQKAKEDERRHKYQAYQEARNKGAQCQSLLNLLNPQLGGVFQQQQQQHHHHEEKAKHATNAETQAVSSQAQTVTQPKLKVKSGQHLLDPAAMQRRLLTTDELSEVGSTTSMSDDGSDANSALWHPLFGSPPKSAGSGGGYVSPWQWTTVTIAGE